MATNYSPKVPTNGLIFCIDPANTKCFSSGRDTCNNLVTGGLVTGANGTPFAGTHTPNTSYFPAYNSTNGGVFDFAGGKGMNVEENLGAHTSLTLSMWIYKNSTSTQYFTDARNNGGTWFLSNYSGENINYTDRLRYNFDASYSSSATEFINKWLHMVVVSDGAGSALYLNGYEISNNPYGYRNSYVSTTSLDEDLGINFRIGTRYTTSGPWTGFMGPIHIYERRLSDEEIYQMYSSKRKRYGI